MIIVIVGVAIKIILIGGSILILFVAATTSSILGAVSLLDHRLGILLRR